MQPASKEAVHADPVWRERADFTIGAVLDPIDTLVRTEQLWARRLGEFRFEVCCIPLSYDLALGDVVETDEAFTVTSVVTDRGHYTFRVALEERSTVRAQLVESLTDLGALWEWSSVSMVAVDAENVELAHAVADLLQAHEDEGELVYETGRTVER